MRSVPLFLLSIVLPAFSQGDELQLPHRTESSFKRDLAFQPLPLYRSGYVYSMNGALNGIWVDHVVDGTEIEKLIELPESFRVVIESVALSFDGTIAVSANATDRVGRFSSVIVWLRLDGSIIRIVRTSPFGSSHLAFTADGSLWAIGVEKASRNEEKVVYDVMRQYDRDGKLVRTLLPRQSLASGDWFPVEESVLVSSEKYVAYVSKTAHKWTLISSEGIVIDSGDFIIPSGMDIYQGAVTESGRIFIGAVWRGDSNVTDRTKRDQIIEIDRDDGVLSAIDTKAAFGDHGALLIGAEGESLVLQLGVAGQGPKIIWSIPD